MSCYQDGFFVSLWWEVQYLFPLVKVCSMLLTLLMLQAVVGNLWQQCQTEDLPLLVFLSVPSLISDCWLMSL